MQNNLTENLKVWRQVRNITKADYLVFVGNVLEELLEPIYNKESIQPQVKQIIEDYFIYGGGLDTDEVVDAIQDIQVFCINETELMGYDNLKCNDEVFQEINSRLQDPRQAMEWSINGSVGKWKKWQEQPEETLYKANYGVCKL